MPFAGLGLHVVLAIICAIHVVRSGQPLYWLFILFSFPLLGSLVYFLVIGIDRITPRWNVLTRELNEPVMRRLRVAQTLARQGR